MPQAITRITMRMTNQLSVPKLNTLPILPRSVACCGVSGSVGGVEIGGIEVGGVVEPGVATEASALIFTEPSFKAPATAVATAGVVAGDGEGVEFDA